MRQPDDTDAGIVFDGRLFELEQQAGRDPLFDTTDYPKLYDRVAIDDSVILEGSRAAQGVRVDELPIEIFWYSRISKSDHDYVELYPLDGMNQPFMVEVLEFNIEDPNHLRGVVAFAIQNRERALDGL